MFSDVIGHKEIIDRLKNAIRSGRIANAYIFSGPSEIGKEFVATNFAKAINCVSGKEDSCDECISCRRINDDNHADVRLIRPEGARLKIEQMRFLKKQGSYKAVEGNYKIYIIAEAEKMTPEAANSILKILEDPPGVLVLILLTSIYSAILPTIRSRCQSLKFSPVPRDVLQEELIRRLELPEAKAKWLAIKSQGKPGRALKLAKQNETQADDKILLSLSVLTGKNELLRIFKTAEDLSKSEDSLDALLSWYRDLMLIKQGCSQELLTHSDKKDLLMKIASSCSDIQIENLIKTTLMTQNLIQRNINPVLAMEVMMLRSLNILSTRL